MIRKKLEDGRRSVGEISLLPQMLWEQSLSDREIVLSHQEAKEALDFLERAHWALLGWEGWVKYPMGLMGLHLAE
jgi:hypothetical protein